MRDRLHSHRLLALLAALAVLAAACGGGSGGDDDGATATDGADADGTEETGDAGDTGATDEEAEDGEGGESAEGGEGGTLVFGTTEIPSTIDPADVYEKLASDILFNTTNRLVEFQPGSDDIGPGLAESWEISDDGLTYTFTLREGVVFQDGSDMTSEDVIWSLQRALNINHPDSAAFLLAGIESMEAPDDHTVVLTLSEANSTFLSRLNYTVGTIVPSDGDVYTAPEERLEAEGDDDAAAQSLLDEAESYIVRDAIVGTGPYEMTDYQPGVSMTLERFDEYWGEAPAIETVRIQFFESTTQMRNALAAGEIDMAVNDLDPTETASLEGEEGIEIVSDAGGRTSYIVLDVTQAPFDDPAVRRTMAAVIDRQRIVDEAFEGQASPLLSMIPDTFDVSEDFISDIEPELEEGAEPIEFTLWYPADRYTNQEQVAEIVARTLNESGLFNVSTDTAEWATEYSTHLNDGSYAAYLLGWYPDYLDPDDYIEPFYDSEDTFIGFYASEEMDELITAEQQETEESARAEIFSEIQQLAAEDMPFIPLYSEGQEAYFSDRVQGVEDTITAAQQTWFYVLSLS